MVGLELHGRPCGLTRKGGGGEEQGRAWLAGSTRKGHHEGACNMERGSALVCFELPLCCCPVRAVCRKKEGEEKRSERKEKEQRKGKEKRKGEKENGKKIQTRKFSGRKIKDNLQN
jgi:hypothetical protein